MPTRSWGASQASRAETRPGSGTAVSWGQPGHFSQLFLSHPRLALCRQSPSHPPPGESSCSHAQCLTGSAPLAGASRLFRPPLHHGATPGPRLTNSQPCLLRPPVCTHTYLCPHTLICVPAPNRGCSVTCNSDCVLPCPNHPCGLEWSLSPPPPPHPPQPHWAPPSSCFFQET